VNRALFAKKRVYNFAGFVDYRIANFCLGRGNLGVTAAQAVDDRLVDARKASSARRGPLGKELGRVARTPKGEVDQNEPNRVGESLFSRLFPVCVL
jgi:hypothetical protein